MKSKKGLTLIELIVSLALVGIIAATFLPMLSTGFINIVRAGDRTKAVNQAANDMVNDGDLVKSYQISVDLVTSKKGETDTLVQVNGNLIVGDVTIKEGSRSEVEVEIFEFEPQ